MTVRVHHVGIRVANLQRSTTFYRDVFGLVVLGRSTLPDAEIAFVGGAARDLSPEDSLSAALAHTGSLELVCKSAPQEYPDVAVLHHIAIEVDRLEATIERARNAGVEVIRPIGEVADKGFRTFWCRGPDGERIEVWQEI